ncbi:hypothetical protein [Actinoplanes couchii]|uniref:Thioesterase domain-containing protein n=1 Tax=Actinoplanes couchii TaxID=403638 RepID=A0ABQ3XIC7_9ACTN|nr:hypothetical protein [Actinoplanes couchii]MDR6324705.1 hypothetical protein [Actinoplanes couchii]GID58262.1 hypothetical protein Aco03nite_066660 [Actinoplanes couchii]
MTELVSCHRGRFNARSPRPRAPFRRDGRLRQSSPAWPVYEFGEADYCYGVGPIRLRLEWVNWSQPIPHEGDTWLAVRGVVIDAAGRDGAVREMLVRASCIPLPPAIRRPRMRALRSTPV